LHRAGQDDAIRPVPVACNINFRKQPVMRELHFEPHELIYWAGDAPDSAFIIKQGDVEIATLGSTARPERLGPGTVFGQVAIMVDQPRQRTARALRCRGPGSATGRFPARPQ
jgi:CRP-like cAMP-binding protein